ncbi:MAG TPA: uracil-DNA glycosylase [Tepidisphaeraceae bacterium]|jgi:DNA polymerase
MDASDPIKHRLMLWLKSEQALGVPAVPRVRFDQNPQEALSKTTPSPSATSTPSQRRTVPAPPPVAPAPPPSERARSSNLFRIETPPPAAGAAALPVLESPFEGPIPPRADKIRLLADLDRDQVSGCVKCGLSRSRANTVFGEGDPDASICFIGEGPGKDEDASGRPFVGRAGQKLDEMIRAMGLRREDVYICNIVKCRAFMTDIGKDRPPSEEETAACTPYLLRQMEIIRPRAIVTLGLPSTRYLLKSKESMTRMRGKWHAWRGIKVMPTWHPAYVLRNYTEQTRREVWDDLKKVLIELDLPIPKRSGKQE